MTTTIAPELDQLASLARTALTDPASIPEDDLIEAEEDATTRDALYGEAAPPATTLYAVAQLDTIIDTLAPAEWTPERAALAIRCLGRHLAAVMDALGDLAETGGIEPADAARLRETASGLGVALDAIDHTLDTLGIPEGEDDEDDQEGADDDS